MNQFDEIFVKIAQDYQEPRKSHTLLAGTVGVAAGAGAAVGIKKLLTPKPTLGEKAVALMDKVLDATKDSGTKIDNAAALASSVGHDIKPDVVNKAKDIVSKGVDILQKARKVI